MKAIESEKKFSSSGKDYKSRISYDKHDSYPKRDRDYDTERSHQTSISSRPPPTAISKYDNSNVFNLGRDRDMRNDPRSRDNTAGAVSNSRYSSYLHLVVFIELVFLFVGCPRILGTMIAREIEARISAHYVMIDVQLLNTISLI